MFLVMMLLFLVITGAATALGMKLYIRPREAMERVVGGGAPAEQDPTHPSLAFHEIIKKLGNIIPQSPKDVTVMQRRLIRAGIRNENALKILYGSKVACGILLPVLTGLAISNFQTDSGNKFAATLAAAAV